MYSRQIEKISLFQRQIRVGVSSYLLGAILGWGLLIRALPLLMAIVSDRQLVAYHSGGLFYAFAVAIRANGFWLPHTIPHYTQDGLPFLYPPLAFYVAALFANAPGMILVLNALCSWLAVLVFARVTAHTSLSPAGRYVAIAAFATLYQTFGSHLPGEGLAESVGTLCLVGFTGELLRYDQQRSWRRAWPLGVWLGLCVLAAPGTAYAVPVTFILAYLLGVVARPSEILQRTKYASYVVGVSVLVASPYLIHIISGYGLGAVFEALSGQQSAGDTVAIMAWALLPREPGMLPIWHALAILGLVACARTRQYFWVIWCFFIASVPREGDWMIAVPVAILVGYSVGHMLLPALAQDQATSGRRTPAAIIVTGMLALCLLYASVGLPITALATARATNAFDTTGYVTSQEAAYLEDLGTTTLPDTRLIVVGNEIEWVPLLAQRTVLNVMYGTEWVPDKSRAVMELNQRIILARDANELLGVLDDLERRYPATFPPPDLVYISKQNAWRRGLEPLVSPALLDDLRRNPCLTLAADNQAALVFTLSQSPGCRGVGQ